MVRISTLVLPLALVACAMPVAEPAEVSLSRSTLRVGMSDGSTCTAGLVGAAPWVGDLPACGLRYVVTPTAAGSPIRLAFDAMISALQSGDLVAPMADIALSDGAGKTHDFTSPVVDDR